uniref:Uncharacterized protein n=1 Tax=Arundo donax TaxID=35708 RepID=A0A0A8XSN9_ARUDO
MQTHQHCEKYHSSNFIGSKNLTQYFFISNFVQRHI